MNDKNIPFEGWQLIQAKEVLTWVRTTGNFSINSINVISCIEDMLFNIAYDKFGLKPIGKCTIQELKDELSKRLGNEPSINYNQRS